ncbi:MAG: HlyD family efflux transporter periplasmic adaptor subunit [Magnetococcales bacterium]|nr:HlyD family efflux transporter periplasmic adaptor subunit [Magnetococcales bacterium]
MNESITQRQLQGAAALLTLEQDARRSQSLDELLFIMVNRTTTVLYSEVSFYFPMISSRPGPLAMVSGVVEPANQSPMVLWLNHFVSHYPLPGKPSLIVRDDIGPEDRKQWQEWMLAAGMMLPLVTPLGRVVGLLLLTRRQEWQSTEMELANRLALCYGHALTTLNPQRFSLSLAQMWTRKLWIVSSICVLIGLLLWPVRQSVTAPARVVPEEPRLVTAPMDGVVASIDVLPNTLVREGQELVTMERTLLANRYAMAVMALRTAKSEALRAEQLSFAREDAKANLPMLQSRVEERRVELLYAKKMLQRSRVRAPGAGLAVFASAEEWLGQPVRTGQRIMAIADPDKVAIVMDLSIHDAIALHPGAEFLLFLDTDPLHSRTGRVLHASYEAQPTPEGVMAFALRGQLTDTAPPPRIGLRGSVRLYGEDTSLFFLLFRRPMSALRQFLGI